MPVRRDNRDRWFFRFTANGASESGVPGALGTPYQHLSNTKKGAEEAERIARANLGTLIKIKEAAPTLRTFVDTFYSDKMSTIGNALGVNKPSVICMKGSHLRCHILPTFGEMRLDAINGTKIEDFKIALAKAKLAPKSINNILGTLHNILTNAKKRGHIEAEPEFEWCRVPQQGFEFLDFEETDRLIKAAARDSEWSCAIVLAIKTGMRLGELRALRWESVDFVKAQVTVCRSSWKMQHDGTPKNGRTRVIDLTPSAVAALKAHRHLRGVRVFMNLEGEDYTPGVWRAAIDRACRVAGLRYVGWHALRHTMASHLVMRGEPLKVVSEILGHTTITMTNRYAHLAPGATRSAVAKLDDAAPYCSEVAAR